MGSSAEAAGKEASLAFGGRDRCGGCSRPICDRHTRRRQFAARTADDHLLVKPNHPSINDRERFDHYHFCGGIDSFDPAGNRADYHR